MSRRIIAIVFGVVLVASACAQANDADKETGATTTLAIVADSTTSTSQATPSTTLAPETTTTATVSTESAGASALKAAFARSADVISGRMEGSFEVSGLDASTGLTEMVVPFGGAFDNTSGDFSFSMDLSSAMAAAGDELPPEFAGLLGEMEVRQIGETTFIKFPFFNQFLGADTPWISMPTDQNDPTSGFTMTSPVNPSEILGSFEDAGATVEVIGVETVNGVDATHYRAIFDTAALLAQASPEERARLEAQGPLPTESLPMDVWISDDGLVIRFIMEIDGDSVDAAPGEGFGQMLMRYDMFDLNAGVVIEPPPPGEVTDVNDLDSFFGFEA
ncbi:MAG: hypothetical protein ACC654_00440 [Acidimicrobiia bacterium]